MASTAADSIDLDEVQLRRRFTTYGVVIEHLLALEPIPIDLIKKKLVQLELALDAQVLTERQFVKLATEWKRKIAKYWEVYTDALMMPANDAEKEMLVPITAGMTDHRKVEVPRLMPPPSPSPLVPTSSFTRHRSLESVLELFCPLKSDEEPPKSSILISLSGESREAAGKVYPPSTVAKSPMARPLQRPVTEKPVKKRLTYTPPLLPERSYSPPRHGPVGSPSNSPTTSATFDFVFDNASNSLSEVDTSSNSTDARSLRPQARKATDADGLELGTAASFRPNIVSPRYVPPSTPAPFHMAKYRPRFESRFNPPPTSSHRRSPSRPHPSHPPARYTRDILSISPSASVPELRAHFEQIFGHFQPIRAAFELGPFKKLTVMVAKASRLLLNIQHLDYAELQTKVFELVFGKLPAEKQEQYEKMHHKKSLRKLVHFLCNHVSSLQRSMESDGGRRPQAGQQYDNRPICLRCFQYNHLIKTCRNEPLLSSNWIDFEALRDEEATTEDGTSQKILRLGKHQEELELDASGFYTFP